MRDLEREREELLRKIDPTLSTQIPDTTMVTKEQGAKVLVVSNTEGTNNAGAR